MIAAFITTIDGVDTAAPSRLDRLGNYRRSALQIIISFEARSDLSTAAKRSSGDDGKQARPFRLFQWLSLLARQRWLASSNSPHD
jgi:hypothetical protein